MEKERPIQRRDFLKSATAASVLAGTAAQAAGAGETPKVSEDKSKDQGRVAAGSALVGLEAADCLAALVRGMAHVRAVYVFQSTIKPPPTKRVIENGFYYDFHPEHPISLTADEEKIVAKAVKLRADSKMPFWDAVLITCGDQENVPHGLLDAALYHRGAGAAGAAKGQGQFISREQLLAGAVKQMCQNKRDAMWVGMTSEVTLDDGAAAQIPFLVFRCPISQHNRKLVAEVAKRLLPGGAVILEAAPTYHAYGRDTVPVKDFAPLMGKALLFGNIINHRYVAHRLIEGKCALRLSSAGKKKTVPLCVEVV